MGPLIGPPSMGRRRVELGVNIFRGTDTTGRRSLCTRDSDDILRWSTWNLTGFDRDGTPRRFELTRDLQVPGDSELNPNLGHWDLGVYAPDSVDVFGNGFTTRILGHGEPGTPPLRERPDGEGRQLRVSFASDFDGDLMMLADVDEVDAETWCVLVTDDFGCVYVPDVYVSSKGESTGYSMQAPGQARWMVHGGRFGTVHVILPDQADVRIRVK